MYYNRARYYNPSNGLFNRIDPFAGSPQDPQSLHKYLYCHANPVNAIDPSGRSYTMAGTLTSLSIVQIVFAAVALTYVAAPDFRKVVEDAAEREIKLLIALAVATGMILKQVFNAARDLVRRLPRSRRKEVYLHYSYKKLKVAFSLDIRGLLPISPKRPEGSFATKTPYPTGWTAKYRLAILHVNPPDAVYLVWPKEGFEPTGERTATAKLDYAHRLMGGGGYEYIFGKGSGGFGTVFGPIPIPKGQFGEWW